MTDVPPPFLSSRMGALGAVAACSLIWGTTWYAITLQLDGAAPSVSVALRFGIAALALFAWLAVRRQPMGLSRAQHVAVFGQGLLTFALQYSLVYAAEQRVASAVVAVIFAALAFANLVLFRVVLRQTATRAAWWGAALGVAGVAALFVGELRHATFVGQAAVGLVMALVGMLLAAGGNLAAWKAQKEGAPVLSSTAWAMTYGAGMVALYALATGASWRIDLTARYLLSLGYLSMFGSVIAFGLYFALARARGYVLASYISALTPPLAMLVSVVLEGARFGAEAFVGLAAVLAGQGLMIHASRRAAMALAKR